MLNNEFTGSRSAPGSKQRSSVPQQLSSYSVAQVSLSQPSAAPQMSSIKKDSMNSSLHSSRVSMSASNSSFSQERLGEEQIDRASVHSLNSSSIRSSASSSSSSSSSKRSNQTFEHGEQQQEYQEEHSNMSSQSLQRSRISNSSNSSSSISHKSPYDSPTQVVKRDSLSSHRSSTSSQNSEIKNSPYQRKKQPSFLSNGLLTGFLKFGLVGAIVVWFSIVYSQHRIGQFEKSHSAQASPLKSARNQEFEAMLSESESEEGEIDNGNQEGISSPSLLDTAEIGIPVLDHLHSGTWNDSRLQSRLTMAFKAASIVRGAIPLRRVETEEEMNLLASDMFELLFKIVESEQELDWDMFEGHLLENLKGNSLVREKKLVDESSRIKEELKIQTGKRVYILKEQRVESS